MTTKQLTTVQRAIKLNHEAQARAPQGYTLWACYPSQANADLAKQKYGCRSDIVKRVGLRPWWALYALEGGIKS